MRMHIKIKKVIAITALGLLASCEPFYDPVDTGDVPKSPGTIWNREPFKVRETVENPFKVTDLSKDMTLAFLLNVALYNNPSTRASWNAALSAAYGYRASLSEYYPTIDYDGEIAAQTHKGTSFATSEQNIISSSTSTPVSTSDTYSTIQINDLSMSYLLLDFGGRDANSELARQTLLQANWTHDYTMQQVMLSVLNAYTSYIGYKGLVQGYEQDLKDAQVALDATQLMHSAGLATLTDVLLTQSTLEQTRTNLEQSKGSERTYFAEILIAAGLPADSPINFEDLPQELPVVEISGNISQLLDLAKENRPDLGAAIAQIKQQEAELAISYSNGMPTLTAYGNWNQVRFLHPRYPSGYNETAYLELDFPLFQGFYYMNEQRQLRASIQEAMANLDVQVAAVASQVVTNYYAYVAAQAALPSAEAAVVYSQRAYRGYVAQYKTGTASVLDVLNSLTSLSNARAQLVLIRTQWASALSNLAFSVGLLTENSGKWEKSPPKDLYQLIIRDDDAPQNL